MGINRVLIQLFIGLKISLTKTVTVALLVFSLHMKGFPMRHILSSICLAVVLNGCGSENSSSPDNSSATIPLTTTPVATAPVATTPVATTPSNESVELAVGIGSTQCMNDGTPLAEWVRRLTANGVEVRASSCGYTGNMYASVCGGSDGRIAIVEVPSAQASTASTIGFFPLSKLPDATKAPC
jgi:hypothetical protein